MLAVFSVASAFWLSLLCAHAHAVHELQTHAEFTALTASSQGRPVVVDFYSDTCAPCQQILPTFHRLSEEFSGRAFFAKVNVMRNQETTAKAGIGSMPTFQFYVNGQMVHSFSSADEAELRTWTAKLALRGSAPQSKQDGPAPLTYVDASPPSYYDAMPPCPFGGAPQSPIHDLTYAAALPKVPVGEASVPGYVPQQAPGFPELPSPANLLQVGDCVVAATAIPYQDASVTPRTTGVITHTEQYIGVDWSGFASLNDAVARPEQLSRMDTLTGKLVAVRRGSGEPKVLCLSAACHVTTPGYGTPVKMDGCRDTADQEFLLPACGQGRIRPKCAGGDCLSVLDVGHSVFAPCVAEQGSSLKLRGRQLEAFVPGGAVGCLDLGGQSEDELVVVPCPEATTEFSFS